MKTIEQFLRDNAIELTEGTAGYKQGLRGKSLEGSGYTLRIWNNENGVLCVYIHPEDRGGDTPFYTVTDNTFCPVKLFNEE